jgi:hypothetical protein
LSIDIDFNAILSPPMGHGKCNPRKDITNILVCRKRKAPHIEVAGPGVSLG